MNDTEKVLTKMLKENTGIHFLDSGGAYGRNWENNQKRNFDKEPATVLSFDNGEISVTHNVYHFLKEHLTFDKEMDKRFHKWAKKPAQKDENWLTLMEQFPLTLKGSGLYGEGSPITVNTYNGNDLLSQTIQYVYFEYQGLAYVLLQIHGGCDVRGGYTKPRVFQTDEYLFSNADATIYCQGGNDPRQKALTPGLEPKRHYWRTDDGYNWYFEGSTEGPNLETFPIVEGEIEREIGQDEKFIMVDAERKGYCPFCGGLLEAHF